ncbi:MAG: hypothetical protein D6746_09375 [Bacteroidetes bacterium]|nr:MAG: hypothetical protein D6746_09375 [Bacteroidota bacterium]
MTGLSTRAFFILILILGSAAAVRGQNTVVKRVPLAALASAEPTTVMSVREGMGQTFVRCPLVVNLDDLALTATLMTPIPEGVHLYAAAESVLGASAGSMELVPEIRRPLISGLLPGDDETLITFTVAVEADVADLPDRFRVALALVHPITGVWAEEEVDLLIEHPARLTEHTVSPAPSPRSR